MYIQPCGGASLLGHSAVFQVIRSERLWERRSNVFK